MMDIEWQQGLYVNYFAANARLLQNICCFHQYSDRRPIGNNSDIATLPNYFWNAQGHPIVEQVGRKLFLQPVSIQAFYYNAGIITGQQGIV
jgi:hypothetical protein